MVFINGVIMITTSIREWRARRQPHPISQAHLARQVGVSRSHIVRLEQGAREPSAEVMFRIARYFGCAVEDVFRYVPPQPQGRP